MVYANNLIEMANKKTTSLEENIRKNLKNSEKAGNRLVSRWSGFYSSKSEDRHHMNHLFVDREFKRSTNLKEHLKFFPSGTAKDDTDHKKKLGVDMGYDLRYMKSKADQDQYQTYIRRLLAARWFIFSVNKVKGEMKRISMIVPQSCYIFLAVYQEVVMLGYENNQLIFYRILEKTITVKDDYRKTVVHVVLSAARGAVHISADAFLEYLNSREIEPPTELIQEIRAQQKNKSRKDKLKANIYRKMRVKHTGIITESDSSRHQIPMAFPSPSSQTVSCDTYDTASSADSADDFGRSDQSYPDIMGIIDGNQPSNNPQGGKGTILAEELDSTSVMSALVEDDAVESN